MRKMIIIAALVIGFASVSNAQVDGNAIGIRFGNGGEISYQHALGSANRLELDLGFGPWNHSNVYLSGVYQWVWDLSELADGFNWYAGVGGAVGFGETLGLGVLGQVGIEFNFNIPIQLSLDWRPVFNVMNSYVGQRYFGYEGIALGVRYKF